MSNSIPSLTPLTPRGKQLRRDLYWLSKSNGGYHYGGTFSTIEILYNLYDHVLKPDDRFILSKGHACWGYYVLLREKGLNPALEGHPHLDLANGVHWTTGSEGHGMPAGVGMAFAKKKMGKPGRVYVLIGDGEAQEGTTWESLLLASKHGLDNLTVIMDNNRIQGSGFTHEVLGEMGSTLFATAEACGWNVRTMNGHSDEDILRVVSKPSKTVPTFIVAFTVKGKGVSFMEDKPEWHSKWPNPEEEAQIMKELA